MKQINSGLIEEMKLKLKEEISGSLLEFGEKEYFTVENSLYSLEKGEKIAMDSNEIILLVNAYNALNGNPCYVDASVNPEGIPSKPFDISTFMFQKKESLIK